MASVQGVRTQLHLLSGAAWALVLAWGLWAVTPRAWAAGEEPPPPEKPAEKKSEEKPKANPRVKLETTMGNIVVELDAEKAPISTENFLQYVRDGFYDGCIFHRVVEKFVIQAGGYDAHFNKKDSALRPPIKNEWSNGLKNLRGTIAMARGNDADSATAQFYINVSDNATLDRPGNGGAGYAVFGKVVEGMDVVDKIQKIETKHDPKIVPRDEKSVPLDPVLITAATTLEDKPKKKMAPAG
jgi:cyclophilin family peptidyl-prolyl cis-trans isomerase